MLDTVKAAPRRTPWRGPTRRTAVPLARRLEPYGYLLPTVLLLLVLMLVPIAMVIRYSVMDNVIVNKNPVFAAFANYVVVLTDPVFWVAVRNTAFFTGASVVAHLVLGMAFALLLNTSVLGPVTKAFFRVLYILPWLFTV